MNARQPDSAAGGVRLLDMLSAWRLVCIIELTLQDKHILAQSVRSSRQVNASLQRTIRTRQKTHTQSTEQSRGG